MNDPVAGTTRASLEVARVALGRMTGAPPAAGAHTAPATIAVRARDAWTSVEVLLRELTGRADLSGQALLTEARQVQALDMDGMHALVALREWTERTMAPGSAAQLLTLPPTAAETDVAAAALAALQRVTGAAALPTAPSLPAQPNTASLSPWAPQPTSEAVDDLKIVAPKPSSAWSPPPAANRAAAPAFNQTAQPNKSSNDLRAAIADNGSKQSTSSGLILGLALLIVAICSVGAFVYVKGRSGTESALTEQGVAAYARGDKESARTAFAKAVLENSNDARALTYLGRISREQGSTATARKYLEQAIRIDPNNGLALRELGSALLGEQEYELARRFYVRALQVDSVDHVAQGFLSCSLFKLNRNEEAQRWMDRAGPGAWSTCAPAPAAAPSKD